MNENILVGLLGLMVATLVKIVFSAWRKKKLSNKK